MINGPCMQRDPRALLSDIEQAAQDILAFTRDASLEQYSSNKMMRMAVEREFSIIGEAIVRARESFPEIMNGIASARNIVAFRNRLVHGYETIRDETIWEAIQKSLPVLLDDVRQMLAQLNG
jgi:uncharacterized protein with HEPN domain